MNLAKLKQFLAGAVLVGLAASSVTSHAANEYEWNAIAPVKTPTSNANGKTVLFDVSHGGTEGNADWVIDGAFSDFADALVNQGYRVEEYRGIDLNNDGLIRYYDDLNTPANSIINEAIITFDAIQHADVFVLAETNRPFKISEYQALEQFVAAGKGIFFIADHYNADRNLNTWDATEVFNGYNRSTLAKYNLGGEYGDLRNPGATSGWLAQQFGIRFRFNSVDYLAGVSDITPPTQTEGITQGVDPILMAAGATLAITDATKAKGLVYFASSDNPTPWRHANDAGLYYGGRDEGPYVAIAKSGAGKAAFIGDSSPIEDATPKYRRQDSGAVKKTYPGWTDPGHASVLSINIINWLATPEAYTHFDNSNGHVSGELTANPKAPTEMDDPDNGNPWSNPSGGYNPWDPATFANGAFGAKFSAGGDTGGGTGGDVGGESLSVSEALSVSNGSNVVVEGVVISELNGIYALVLGDDQDNNQTLNVKLESDQRTQFSPQLNPAILGHHIRVNGTRNDYMSQPGVRSVTLIEDLGVPNSTDPDNNYTSVSDALNTATGTTLEVEGFVVEEVNGIYGLLLQDIHDASKTINVKLESAQRNDYNPQLNPSIVGARIVVSGKRDSYMGQAGMRYVSDIITLSP